MIDAAVIGAGAWGTAFAIRLARKQKSVLLWAYEPDLVPSMRQTRENGLYLPGLRLADNIELTDSLEEAVSSSAIVIVATPSFALRETARRAAPTVGRQRRHQPPRRQAAPTVTDPRPGRCFVFEPGDVFRRPASGARPLRRWWWRRKGRAEQAGGRWGRWLRWR